MSLKKITLRLDEKDIQNIDKLAAAIAIFTIASNQQQKAA